MAKLTNEELIEAFKELTIIELSEFVKLFEETFEVTAAAVAVAGPAAGAAEEAEEDRSDQGSSRHHLPGPQGSQGPG